MSEVRTVACPHCGKAVEWTPSSRYRPFCSERCKMIDLGAWAAESYRIPVEPSDADSVDPRPPDDEPNPR